MKIKETCAALIVSLTLATVPFNQPNVLAAESDLIKRQQELLNEIKKNENLLNQKKQEESKTASELKILSGSIVKTDGEIKKIESNLVQAEKEITKLNTELKESEEKIDEQTQYLSKRIREMYMDGDIKYLEVLLQSSSITDFLTRWDLFTRLAQNDNEIINDLNQEVGILNEKRLLVVNKQEKLEEMQGERESKRNQLTIASSRTQTLLKDIQEEKNEYAKMLDALEAESEKIAQEIRRLQGPDNTDYLGTGKFNWPTPGYTRITSPYGNRIHPILKTRRMHTGIDIGAPMNAAIVAAERGKVIFAGWNAAYGRMVIISHGGDITSMYAHMTSYSVKEGQEINKGDKIGKVGSTGWSTGPHLHFEVRKNGNPVDPMAYLK